MSDRGHDFEMESPPRLTTTRRSEHEVVTAPAPTTGFIVRHSRSVAGGPQRLLESEGESHTRKPESRAHASYDDQRGTRAHK